MTKTSCEVLDITNRKGRRTYIHVLVVPFWNQILNVGNALTVKLDSGRDAQRVLYFKVVASVHGRRDFFHPVGE